MVNKSFFVQSLEVNIFNYVFHLEGGIVWRVEGFHATTKHLGKRENNMIGFSVESKILV